MGLLDKLFGGRLPDIPTPVRASTAPPSAPDLKWAPFVLGLDIEEVYSIFGEHLQSVRGGIPHEMFAVIDRKIDRIQTTAQELGIAKGVDTALSTVRARLRRGAGGDLDDKKPGGLFKENMQTAGLIDNLMGALRKRLDEEKGCRYDVGIYCGRLSLCARSIGSAALLPPEIGQSRRELYTKEIARAGENLANILSRGEQSGVLRRAFTPEEADTLKAIAGMAVTTGESEKPDVTRAIYMGIEQILSVAGFKSSLNRGSRVPTL